MEKLGLVLLPVWGAGHIVSMVEAAKRLLQFEGHSFFITVLIMQPPYPGASYAFSSYLRSVASSGLDIRFQDLPPVEHPAADGVEDLVSRYVEKHKASVKAVITSLSSSLPVAALVLDFFATTLIDVAHELGIPSYIYFTSPALMLHLPELGEKTQVSFEEMEEEVDIPGASPMPAQAMPTPLMNNKTRNYDWFVYHGRRFLEAKGILVNTFAELEPRPLKAIEEGHCAKDRPAPLLYPIGPILHLEGDAGQTGGEKHECIEWLDGQPPASAVFLCFGSRGRFDASQAREVAIGLERSGWRFLWCLRAAPPGNMRGPVDAKPEEVLPEGFLDRTAGRGLVWPSWAPQKAILAHGAVGGVVTHCGWNSTLESLWFGVPMLGWPLYAEQHLNAFEMVRELGVAVELKVDRKGGNFVTAEELERGVRCLMEDCEEGNRVRARVAEMSLASRKAIEKGGSSHDSLHELADEIDKSARGRGASSIEY